MIAREEFSKKCDDLGNILFLHLYNYTLQRMESKAWIMPKYDRKLV